MSGRQVSPLQMSGSSHRIMLYYNAKLWEAASVPLQLVSFEFRSFTFEFLLVSGESHRHSNDEDSVCLSKQGVA